SAANAAVWAARSGADATVVGRVGDDLAGRALRSALEERGVRSELTVDPDAPTGTFLVIDGDVRADRGANARFKPARLLVALAGGSGLADALATACRLGAAAAASPDPWPPLAAGVGA